jgi:MFS family permease
MVDPVRADLNLSDFEISLLQGLAFALLFAVVGFPVSRLADRKSRRGILAAGISFWCVMTAMCGLSTNFLQLFLARMGTKEACFGFECLLPWLSYRRRLGAYYWRSYS